MSGATGPPTVFFEIFWAQQKRKRLLETALEEVDLPAQDYPLYVVVGAEGPWTPTLLAERLMMPLSTLVFRVKQLERRRHAERIPNPADGRSYLIRLTEEGQRLLDEARPAFRSYAEAVERRLGAAQVEALKEGLSALRQAVDEELGERARRR